MYTKKETTKFHGSIYLSAVVCECVCVRERGREREREKNGE